MEKSNYNNNFYQKHNNNRENIFLKINGPLDPAYSIPEIIKKSYGREKRIQILYGSNRIISDILFFDFQTAIKNSVLMQLASTLIQTINLKSIDIKTNKILSNDFYTFCLNNLLKTNIIKTIDDNELLIIYLKQLVMIIKNTDLYNKKNNILSGRNLLLNKIQLYLKILDSFWNKSIWSELFPSMPDAASRLMKNKNVMVDLVLKNKNNFKIADISNDFSSLTGISKPNDLFFISFLDFYFFTWLSHFGIIRYINGADIEPVEIELTEHGRRILKYLLMR